MTSERRHLESGQAKELDVTRKSTKKTEIELGEEEEEEVREDR